MSKLASEQTDQLQTLEVCFTGDFLSEVWCLTLGSILLAREKSICLLREIKGREQEIIQIREGKRNYLKRYTVMYSESLLSVICVH